MLQLILLNEFFFRKIKVLNMRNHMYEQHFLADGAAQFVNDTTGDSGDIAINTVYVLLDLFVTCAAFVSVGILLILIGKTIIENWDKPGGLSQAFGQMLTMIIGLVVGIVVAATSTPFLTVLKKFKVSVDSSKAVKPVRTFYKFVYNALYEWVTVLFNYAFYVLLMLVGGFLIAKGIGKLVKGNEQEKSVPMGIGLIVGGVVIFAMMGFLAVTSDATGGVMSKFFEMIGTKVQSPIQ